MQQNLFQKEEHNKAKKAECGKSESTKRSNASE
jgi:hypothetical protein